jgi:signal transduction histidine kinase
LRLGYAPDVNRGGWPAGAELLTRWVPGVFLAGGGLGLLARWAATSPSGLPTERGWDTALAFTACGVALLANRPRISRTLALLAALVGGVTLLQYVLSVDPAWLTSPWLKTQGPQPGRMGPNTALGFALVGAALLFRPHRPMLRLTLAAGALALAIVALLGHSTGIESAYAWMRLRDMAPWAAIAFLVLGTAQFAFAWRQLERRGDDWARPLVAGGGVAAGAILFSLTLDIDHERLLRLRLDEAADGLHRHLRTQLTTRLRTLEVLAREWGLRGAPSPRSWETDARLVQESFPAMYAVSWTSFQEVDLWRYRLDADDPELQTPEPSRTLAAPVQSLLARTPRGRVYLQLSARVREGGTERGRLSGYFDAQQLVDEIIGEGLPGFALELHSGEYRVYSRGQSPDPRLRVERAFSLPDGSEWQLRVSMGPEVLAAHGIGVGWLVLSGGVALGALVGALVRMYDMASQRALELDTANEVLAQTDAQLRALATGLEQRVALRTEELSQRNQELRHFARFLSHELRQPLNSISLISQLFAERQGAKLDLEGREQLERIIRASHRMSELIDEQMALAWDLPVRKSPVSLQSLLDEAVQPLEGQIRAAGAELHARELPQVYADPASLSQVLRNLVDNALKNRRPEVPLRIEVTARPLERGWEVTVADNGTGFPPAEADKLFEIGTRLRPQGKPGGGLGLPLARRIVERHGGWIRAEAQPGAGARFRLWLPGPEPDAGPAASAGPGARV